MDIFYEERICTGEEYSRDSILEALVGIGNGVGGQSFRLFRLLLWNSVASHRQSFLVSIGRIVTSSDFIDKVLSLDATKCQR